MARDRLAMIAQIEGSNCHAGNLKLPLEFRSPMARPFRTHPCIWAVEHLKARAARLQVSMFAASVMRSLLGLLAQTNACTSARET